MMNEKTKSSTHHEARNVSTWSNEVWTWYEINNISLKSVQLDMTTEASIGTSFLKQYIDVHSDQMTFLYIHAGLPVLWGQTLVE